MMALHRNIVNGRKRLKLLVTPLWAKAGGEPRKSDEGVVSGRAWNLFFHQFFHPFVMFGPTYAKPVQLPGTITLVTLVSSDRVPGRLAFIIQTFCT